MKANEAISDSGETENIPERKREGQTERDTTKEGENRDLIPQYNSYINENKGEKMSNEDKVT